jgi:hypothetical protein
MESHAETPRREPASGWSSVAHSVIIPTLKEVAALGPTLATLARMAVAGTSDPTNFRLPACIHVLLSLIATDFVLSRTRSVSDATHVFHNSFWKEKTRFCVLCAHEMQ